MPPKGIKKQVLGGILFCLGAMTALLAGTIGFELDIFYVVISIVGAGLFLYGAIQNKQHKLTSGIQGASINSKSYTHLASRPAPMRKSISTHGD
ncbi:MAG: hypothetical protein NUV63_10165 [Gallionella sp.]|nr:hypothetical protein [Gallionella sp.]